MAKPVTALDPLKVSRRGASICVPLPAGQLFEGSYSLPAFVDDSGGRDGRNTSGRSKIAAGHGRCFGSAGDGISDDIFRWMILVFRAARVLAPLYFGAMQLVLFFGRGFE